MRIGPLYPDNLVGLSSDEQADQDQIGRVDAISLLPP